MLRPSYSVVTGVTVTLAAICGVRLLLQGLIPPPHPELSYSGGGAFIRRAAKEDIAWRTPGPEAFNEAQRLSRPLLVVVGIPWSAVGRQADAAFASAEVARAVNRGFVPIRIDGSEDPRWIFQFLPLERTRSGFSVGFQAWVFDLKGRLIDFIGRVGGNDVLDQNSLLDGLLAAQADFNKAALEDAPPLLEQTQRADAGRVLSPGVADLSLPAASATLADSLANGWSVRGISGDRPLAFRFLQLVGEWDTVGRGLRSAVLSGKADWLDGGFFRLQRVDARLPEFDKAMVTNAQFAEVLAVQDAIRPDPLLRQFARMTLDWILGSTADGLVPVAEEGDEDESGHSRRSSFSPRRLRDAVTRGFVTQSDRDWAQTAFSLGSPSRIALPNESNWNDPRTVRVLAALRRAAGSPRHADSADFCDVNGSVAASLLRCARLMGDDSLAQSGGTMVDRLEAFGSKGHLRHSLRAGWDSRPFLGDYLAYADAELEDYLTNGRIVSLERGTTVLRNALRTFAGEESDILFPSPPHTPLLPGAKELPQVTDDEREALSAAALRLCSAYAAVLGPTGHDFAASASGLNAHLGAVADAVPALGGALGALARYADARAVFVVGPDALAQSHQVARRLPDRLVVPVIGPVRAGLRERPAGLYLATGVGMDGPLDFARVQSRLSQALQVGN